MLDNFTVDQSEINLEVLDIPDEYQYMDEDLVEILEIKLSDVFGKM